MQRNVDRGGFGRRGFGRIAACLAAMIPFAGSAIGQESNATGNAVQVNEAESPRMVIGGPKKAPVHFWEKGPTLPSTNYATGEVTQQETNVLWKYMCGSDETGKTVRDLKASAAQHAAEFAPGAPITVVDTPRQGFGPRGPGNVNVIFNLGGSVPPAAVPSFAAAEAYIESKWLDGTTITVNVSFANLGGGVLGSTGSTMTTSNYTTARNGLINGQDANDYIEDFLPTGTTVPVRFTASSASVTNVGTITWTSANYRATVGTFGGSDANMQYNNTFPFDYDPSNGITAGQYSLVDIVIHEVGHSMGFVSAADPFGFSGITSLDLYRFARLDGTGTDWNPDTAAEFQTTARCVEGSSNTDDANANIFSSSGTDSEYRMSDGNPYQASHFREQSSPFIGIMDPAFAAQQTFYPNHYLTADLAMFDAIGWNDVGGTCTGPAITGQPSSQTVCQGIMASFSVTATGTGPLDYQWRKNGTNIVGATSSTYSLTSTIAGDAGNYDCVVTNACGTVTSNVAVLTVNVAPSITTNPVAATRCVGTSVTFSVTATGTAPLSYQWRKNGINIAGATSSSHTIASVATGDAGTYSCTVSNACGSTPSGGAALTVQVGPAITSQPSNQTVCAGAGASFSVTATGTPLPTYQWRKNGTNIGGATSSTYSIASTVVGDAGSYDCLVTNACGTVTSNAASLTVNTAPFTGSVANQSACPGGSATFSVSAGGIPAPTFQWRKNGTNIGGATSSSYTINPVGAGDAGSYDCVVTNACGSATSNAATLTVNAGPSITTHPTNETVSAGATANFVVIAGGTAPLSYQWRKDGSNLADGGDISGATTANLAIANAAVADEGSYDVIVTNACGSVTSNAATLDVGTTCVADVDDGSGTGTTDGAVDISDLLYFLDLFDAGDIAADVDDGSSTNTPDGAVDISDLLYFLLRFDAGC